jgi:hypothetical protein
MATPSTQLAPDLADRLARLLGTPPQVATPIHRGYTTAERWRVTLADGRTVFAKVATNALTADWLRDEWRIYGAVRAAFLPACLAWDPGDGEAAWPLLVLEDLSEAHWPPPWRPGDVERLCASLEALAGTTCPPGVPDLEDLRSQLAGWELVAADPSHFLSLGVADGAWLDRCLDRLVAAEAAAVLSGPSLLHVDVRSDNVCFTADRAVLVDWNWAQRGNPKFDLAFWAASLAYEGGPAPEALVGHEPELAAFVSGFFGARAGKPPFERGERVRELQRRQLTTALPWAVRALGLPQPTAPRS